MWRRQIRWGEEFESSGVLYWYCYWDWHWYWWPGILLVLVDITESERTMFAVWGGYLSAF